MPEIPMSACNPAPRPAEAEKARGFAMRLLTLRPRTVSEVQHRLGQRFDRQTVERTVTRLQAEGLLNDADFASQWRESRERRKPRSQGMIERELKQRGGFRGRNQRGVGGLRFQRRRSPGRRPLCGPAGGKRPRYLRPASWRVSWPERV